MPTPKTKERKCKCGNSFEPFQYPNSTIKTKQCVPCLIKKGRKKEQKEWNKEKKKIKLKLKNLSDYEAEARKEFQKWVRLRDSNLPCVSCGTMFCQIWQGGHMWKAEIYSGLIFHPDNCHKQCHKCNHFESGNEANYRIGLIKRIGEERVKWLEENKDRLRNYKYTKQELIDIKNKYQLKIKNKDYGKVL